MFPMSNKFLIIINKWKNNIIGDWGLGIGDWGLGIGDWGIIFIIFIINLNITFCYKKYVNFKLIIFKLKLYLKIVNIKY